MMTEISVLATRKKVLISDTQETVHISSKQSNVNKIFSVTLTRQEKIKEKIN